MRGSWRVLTGARGSLAPGAPQRRPYGHRPRPLRFTVPSKNNLTYLRRSRRKRGRSRERDRKKNSRKTIWKIIVTRKLDSTQCVSFFFLVGWFACLFVLVGGYICYGLCSPSPVKKRRIYIALNCKLAALIVGVYCIVWAGLLNAIVAQVVLTVDHLPSLMKVISRWCFSDPCEAPSRIFQ